MKKIITALLLISFILVPLAGCGEEESFSETITISAETPSFTTNLYSVSFGPGILTKDTELTVSEVSVPPLFYEGENSKIYNFSLDKIDLLTTVSDFSIPIEVSDEETAVAAYYDGTQWTPVNYTYENGEVVIHSTLLGTYGAFAVKKAGIFDAAMQLYFIPSSDEYFEKSVNFFVDSSDSKPSDETGSELFSEIYSYALGIDISASTLENNGFDKSYIDAYKETSGKAGCAYAAYQTVHKIRSLTDGNTSLSKLKDIAKKADKLPDPTLKQYLSTAIRAAIAYTDYCVTPYKELAPSTTTNTYKTIYNNYYSENGKGYRDVGAWYRELYSILAEGYYEPSETSTTIKNAVSKYTNALWDDPKLLQEQKNAAIEKGFDDPGKVTKDIKKELVNELEGNLYNGFVKEGMLQAIKQLEQKAYSDFKEAFEEYCEYVQKNVTLTLYTSSSVDEFADCIVQFENLPKDAEGNVPPCTLNANGEGTISFKVLSFIRHELTPVLTITDDSDNVKRLEITLHVPNNEIDLCDAK